MCTNTTFFKTISLITLFFFLHACTVHTLKEVPKEKIKNVERQNTLVIHQDDKILKLTDFSIYENNMSGISEKYISDSKSMDQYKEVHVYLNNFMQLSLEFGSKIDIPFVAIDKIEIYQIDPNETTSFTIKTLVGFGIVILIAILYVGYKIKTEGVMSSPI